MDSLTKVTHFYRFYILLIFEKLVELVRVLRKN